VPRRLFSKVTFWGRISVSGRALRGRLVHVAFKKGKDEDAKAERLG